MKQRKNSTNTLHQHKGVTTNMAETNHRTASGGWALLDWDAKGPPVEFVELEISANLPLQVLSLKKVKFSPLAFLVDVASNNFGVARFFKMRPSPDRQPINANLGSVSSSSNRGVRHESKNAEIGDLEREVEECVEWERGKDGKGGNSELGDTELEKEWGGELSKLSHFLREFSNSLRQIVELLLLHSLVEFSLLGTVTTLLSSFLVLPLLPSSLKICTKSSEVKLIWLVRLVLLVKSASKSLILLVAECVYVVAGLLRLFTL